MKNFSIITRFLVLTLAWTACMVQAANLVLPGNDEIPSVSSDISINASTDVLTDVPTDYLRPSIRSESLDKNPIFTIAPHVIAPFLTRHFVLEESDIEAAPRIVATQEGREFLGMGDQAYVVGDLSDIEAAPRIVATQEGREFLGMGDQAYVVGDLKGNALFQVFRPSKPVIDPVTKHVIAHEAVYLGTLQLQRSAGMHAMHQDAVHTFVVKQSKEEMRVGDRLVAVPIPSLPDYVPHLPKQQVDARIVAIDGGMVAAGQHQVVAINRGVQDGVDVGAVLALSRSLNQVANHSANLENSVKLPDEQYGTVFIFRVFNHVAYGLIMQVTDAVRIGDVAKSPE